MQEQHNNTLKGKPHCCCLPFFERRNMKKIISILGVIIVILTVLLCIKDKLPFFKEDVINTEEVTNTESTLADTDDILSHINVDRGNGPEGELLKIPLYYQQDYIDVPYNNGTIATNGNLITCLSMLDSFYNFDFITPDSYLDTYDVNGITGEDLINEFAEHNNREVIKYSFDAETLGFFLVNERREVLVHITHPSIYGSTSSYIIVTTCTADGMLCVRDPNQWNIDNYAIFSYDEEFLYDPTVFCEQASSSSEMYVFIEKAKGDNAYENE